MTPITMDEVTTAIGRTATEITICESKSKKHFSVTFETQNTQEEADLDALLVDTKGLIKVE
jgi:hypothetical protein